MVSRLYLYWIFHASTIIRMFIGKVVRLEVSETSLACNPKLETNSLVDICQIVFLYEFPSHK